MLRLWGRPNSYNVQKVIWFLDELSIDYENVNVGSTTGDLESAEFLSLNPLGLIPVIQDENQTIWESNTILRYIASKYGAKEFWSDNAFDRSKFERWMDWEATKLQPDFLGLFWGYYRTPENQRNLENIDRFKVRCQYNLAILDKVLKESIFVVGSKFSLADIVIGTSFYRYYNMGIDVPEYRNIRSWYQRLSERVSYQRKIAVPFKELRGRLEF